MEFNSDRKRMSILFKDPSDGLIKLYCKGADSIIKERLDPKQIDESLSESTDKFLSLASEKGLRTLLFAMKPVDKEECDEFLSKVKEAEKDVVERDKKLSELYDRFETDLVLLGATAVEDRLQDNVPETIADL